MRYQELVDVYSALEATTKRLEKTEIISEYLKKLDSDTIEKVGLLILGVVFPAWSSEEIGIGGKLVEKIEKEVKEDEETVSLLSEEVYVSQLQKK